MNVRIKIYWGGRTAPTRAAAGRPIGSHLIFLEQIKTKETTKIIAATTRADSPGR